MIIYRYLNLIIQFLFIRISYIDADRKVIIFPVMPLSGYITKNIFPRLVDYPKVINVILLFITALVLIILSILTDMYFMLKMYYVIYCLWCLVCLSINQILYLLENKIKEQDKQINKVDERNKREK